MAKSNMKKYERQCCVCNHHYVHCNVGCSEFRNSEPWKSSFDSFNCYTLYNITAGYVNGWLPKEQEAERLKSIDLSYFDDLAEWTKQPILEMKAMWNEQGEEVEKSEQVEKKEVVEEDNSKEITTTEVKEDIKEEVVTETNTTKESSKSKDYTKDYNKNRYRNKK